MLHFSIYCRRAAGKVRLLRSVFYLSVICFFAACGGDKTDCFSDGKFDAFGPGLQDKITAYYDVTFSGTAAEQHGKPRMYIDFSSGIYEAYKNNTNSELIRKVFNTLSGGIDVYKLDKDSIMPMENANSDIIGRMVTETTSYHGKYAPIKKAVEDIVNAANDAILVTDFEEYYPPNSGREEITDVAAFKDAFSKWLANGNSIRFYISDYNEKGIDKHLYFTVFSRGNPGNNSVLARINESLKGLNTYNLTATPYTLSAHYAAEKTGGCFYDNTAKDEHKRNILDLDRDTYVNGLQQNKHFEFYQFNVDWKTIAELKKDYQQENRFKDFFRNLFIDLSDEDAYRIDALDVKVYDVTEDYLHFAQCEEVKKHKPKITKGSNGENKIDESSDDIARTCYEPNGLVKKEWLYTADANNGKELKEVFALNKELFVNNKKEHKNQVEIGTVFHPDFEANLPAANGLLRLDIVITGAEPTSDNTKLEAFTWTSTTEKPKQNRALRSSIENAINDPKVKPVNKVIYSYYIKTL